MPQNTLDCHSEIRYLKGVGEKRAAAYRKMNVDTIGGLLYHLPRDYIDLSGKLSIEAALIGENAAVRATVLRRSPEQRIRKGLSLWKVLVTDGTRDMLLMFFNTKYTVESLRIGFEYIFYGLIHGTLLNREMSAPMVISAEKKGGLLPIYPAAAGLSSRQIAAHIQAALSICGPALVDPIPPEIRREEELLALGEALCAIHRPASLEQALNARRRLVFEEFFTLTAAMHLLRRGRSAQQIAPMSDVCLSPLWHSLPFSPTAAQLRAISEIAGDLRSGHVMNRLLQGDVGSGKTLVAAAAAFYCCHDGEQAAMMAPTEILAEQHYGNLKQLLAPLGIRLALLIGSLGAPERRRVLKALSEGQIDFIIGTHALLTGDVRYHSLSLVITDEQHRFGVAQRADLGRKGEHCHVLVMSATPIPRTLSLIIYGDLDISVLDELPEGRKPVRTYRIDSAKRERAFAFIRKHLDAGRQAYVVCPLIEESELSEHLLPAVDYAEELASGAFAGYRIGLLHGRMKSREKEAVMRRFKTGGIQLLVSTTVIEVGVDVPGATVMLIENAERFGLSQLHQLRGRIGRGSEQSHCILLTDSKSSETLERLDVIVKTADGFAIADADLRLRGAGDFFGSRQHGLPRLRVADLGRDGMLLQRARQSASRLMEADPDLQKPEHAPLRRTARGLIASVGTAPN